MPPEDNKPTGSLPEGSSVDELKNIKAEFNRKLGNVEETLKKSNEQLLAQMQAMLKPKASVPATSESDDIEDLFYKDPKAYTARVVERTTQQINSTISQREAETAQRNSVLTQLTKEFPELNVDDHELTQTAIKKYNDMARDSGATPATYRAAVYEAALEQGIKPRSKRPADSDDDFSLRGSGSGRRSAKPKDELDPLTIEAAKAFGVDPEKVKARVKARKSFMRWE